MSDRPFPAPASRPARRGLAISLAALAFAGAAACLAARSGGTGSPFFTALVALPLLAAVVLPHLPWLTVTLGAGVIAFGAAVVLAEPRPLAWLARWAFLAAVCTGFAVVGSRAYRRSVRAALAAEHERAEVAARLVESDRRRARAERLALAGRVAAGVAHEIANPLCFVKANVRFVRERLQEAGPGFGDATEAAEETLQGVERIAQIVADMRGLARESARSVGACDVGALVREAVRLASGRQPAVRVEADVAACLPTALASPRLLVQALVNLLVNGADAAVGGPPERRWVRCSVRAEGGGLRLEVADGGPGLSAEARARLFEPFFTTKGTSGTGLGLALTRENVQACGGSLELLDGPGPGAVFLLRLQVAAAGAEEAVPTPVPFAGVA